MQNIGSRNLHKTGNLFSFLLLFMGAMFGILIGFSIQMLGPLIASIVIPGIIIMTVVLFKAPEYGILILLIFVSGILPNTLNPFINLGFGNFQVSDIILISLLVVVMLKLIFQSDFSFHKTPLDLPVLLFCIAVVIGIGTAVINHGIRFSYTTYDARILLHYSLFFAVTNLIRTKSQLMRLLRGFILIGIFVALLIFFQALLGNTFQLVSSEYFKESAVLRAYHPGFVVVFIILMVIISLLTISHTTLPIRITYFIVLLIMGLAVLFSLTRNVIVSTALSIIVLFILLRGMQLSRLVMSLIVLGMVVIAGFTVLTLVNPESVVLAYPSSIMQRFSNLFSVEGLSGESNLYWRFFELRFAWEKVVENPMWGIGLHTNYRPPFIGEDAPANFIHNGYMMVWLKTGLIGLIAFLWFIILFQARGFRLWARVHDDFLQATALGFSLVFFAMMFSNWGAPLFVENFNLAFFAAMMGINEVIFSLNSLKDQTEPAVPV